MLDQSFSAGNFRKILDIENRKGFYLEGEFYADIDEINKKIKDLNSDIRILGTKGLSKEDYIKEREAIDDKKEELKAKREEKLIEKLAVVSSAVTAENFKLQIVVDTTITAKPVYKTAHNLENILALKQLQYNFRKLYKVKQSNRYSIISQLKNLLDDSFPKIIVKTDIKEFYESIPHDKLLKKLYDENLLTHLSRRFIQQILSEYKTLAATTKGVPRGIGISPYLTELYMRDVDAKIKCIPNVMYYARYVDDIIVIFMPDIVNTTRDYKKTIKDIFIDEGLTMNEDIDKTRIIGLTDKHRKQNYFIEYLGYKFISGYDANKHIPLKLTISEKKKKRYGERLSKAFTLYEKQSKGNEKQARKLFVKRIKFLTSNTRLVNNKRNVITGIYYTNSLVNTNTDFHVLDRYFATLIRKFALPAALANRISPPKNSFVKGFDPTCISKFNAIELNTMMKSWTK
ncbi:MAG: hypothetical protein IH597_16125 [Bacteroidales bacterium]|nr:hypothetical protein [Bacteroidales bacterium]